MKFTLIVAYLEDPTIVWMKLVEKEIMQTGQH